MEKYTDPVLHQPKKKYNTLLLLRLKKGKSISLSNSKNTLKKKIVYNKTINDLKLKVPIHSIKQIKL